MPDITTTTALAVEQVANASASPSPTPTASQTPPAAQEPTTTQTATPESKGGGKHANAVREALKGDEAFWNRILPPKEKKQEAAKAGEPSKETETAAAPETAPAATTEAKPTEETTPAQPKRRVKKPELDPTQLIEASASAGARAAVEAIKATQPPPSATETPAIVAPEDFAKALPDEWAEDADTYLEMARLQPDKYGDLPKRLVAYSKAEEGYIRKWQRDHPGEEFDPESADHADFYETNTPDINPRDFKQAERSIVKRQAIAEVQQEFQPEIEELRSAKRSQAVQPIMHRESMETLGEILGAINKDYAKLIEKPEKISELAQSDQLGAEVATQVADATIPLVQTVIALHSGVAAYDERNPVHNQVFRLILDAEDKIAAMGHADQVDQKGRLFARREDYLKMSKAEQARHWFLGQDEMLEILKGQARNRAGNLYKAQQTRLEAWAKAHGYAKPDVTNAARATQPAKPTETTPAAAPAAATPAAPSVTGRAAAASEATPATSQAKSGADMFFERLLGK